MPSSSYGRSKPTARQRTRTIIVDHLGSSYAAGFISVLMLALAGVTRFGAHLQGAWHLIYVVSAGAALYFNLLFGVVGASSQTEPPLFVAQFAVALPFVGVTVAIIRRFRRAALADGELAPRTPGKCSSTTRPSSTRTSRSNSLVSHTIFERGVR